MTIDARLYRFRLKMLTHYRRWLEGGKPCRR